MKKQIEIRVFSEETGKVFVKEIVRPNDPIGWDFDEDDFTNAIKKALKYFIGKVIFFSDKKNVDELYQAMVNVRDIPKLETVQKEWRFRKDNFGGFTLMCKNKNGITDSVRLGFNYIEER